MSASRPGLIGRPRATCRPSGIRVSAREVSEMGGCDMAPKKPAAPVYVGGFVDVVRLPKTERELYLDADVVAKFLPLERPIPLTVEHAPGASVGWVLGLHQVKHGLFCIGAVTSRKFLTLLDRLFSSSSVAQMAPRDGGLPREPRLEMLHTWLPELSLASAHPSALAAAAEAGAASAAGALADTGAEAAAAAATDPLPRGAAFEHVSLCALGRRRGTVAVYGPDVEWVLSKFTSMSHEERRRLGEASMCVDLEALEEPDFSVEPEELMAKAIDAGFISCRLDLLKTDRGVAAVQRPTYLKASARPAPPPGDSLPSAPSQKRPMAEDAISVPKATFMAMLQSNLDAASRQQQQQRQPQQQLPPPQQFPQLAMTPPQQQPLYPPQQQPLFAHPPHAAGAIQGHSLTGAMADCGVGGGYFGQYAPAYHLYPGAAATTAPAAVYGMPITLGRAATPFVGPAPVTPAAYTFPATEGYGYVGSGGAYSPTQFPSRPGKRKRDGDAPEESGPFFPGEESNYRKDLMSMSRNIADIQNELRSLRQLTSEQQQLAWRQPPWQQQQMPTMPQQMQLPQPHQQVQFQPYVQPRQAQQPAPGGMAGAPPSQTAAAASGPWLQQMQPQRTREDWEFRILDPPPESYATPFVGLLPAGTSYHPQPPQQQPLPRVLQPQQQPQPPPQTPQPPRPPEPTEQPMESGDVTGAAGTEKPAADPACQNAPAPSQGPGGPQKTGGKASTVEASGNKSSRKSHLQKLFCDEMLNRN
nr:capsid protein-P40 [Eptesicus fuscus gammaherpesvirus]